MTAICKLVFYLFKTIHFFIINEVKIYKTIHNVFFITIMTWNKAIHFFIINEVKIYKTIHNVFLI